MPPHRFMNWHMPFMRPPRAIDYLSPPKPVCTPDSDFAVDTPPFVQQLAASPHSLGQALSPRNAPSPTTALVIDTAKIERAGIFLQGGHMQLLEGMSGQEKM